MDFILFLLNTVWLTAITITVGWGLYPRGFIKGSSLFNVPLWLALGQASLFLSSSFLVHMNYPGAYVIYIIPFILLYGLLHFNKYFPLRKIPVVASNWQSFDKKNTYKALGIVYFLSLFVFYFPFLIRFTSGYYSISGGDLSIYLRVSDFFVHHGLLANLPDKVNLLPPYPNWNILTYIANFRENGSGLITSSLTALPYMSLSLSGVEDAYTISLFISFVNCVMGSSLFFIYLFRKGDGYFYAGALPVIFSNLVLWMAASHATPAFTTLGLSFNLLLLLFFSLEVGSFYALGLAVLISGMLQVYLPYFLLSIVIPFSIYILYKLISLLRNEWRFIFVFLCKLVLSSIQLMFLIYVFNLREYSKILSMLSTADFAGADFGLQAKHAFLTVTGSADFDLLFPTALGTLTKYSSLCYAVSSITIIGLILLLWRSNWLLRFIVFSQVSLLSYFAWLKIGGTQTQYAGIRFAEMACIYFAAAAGIGFTYFAKEKLSSFKKVASHTAFASLILGSFILTTTLWARVLLWVPHEHSAFFTSDDIRMASKLSDLQKNGLNSKNNTVYWFGSGPISFAGSEVLFRNVRYLESYDYDYYNYIKTHSWWRDVNLDILDDQYLNNSIFAIPDSWRNEIISDQTNLISEPTWVFGKNKVYDTNTSSGIVLIGDAWNPPVLWLPNIWGRYLKGRDGGIVIWSQHPKDLVLELTVDSFAENMALEFFDNHDKHIGLFKLNKPRTNTVISFEYSISPGINVLRVRPIGKYNNEKQWGLTTRKETDWVVFTRLNVFEGKMAKNELEKRSFS